MSTTTLPAFFSRNGLTLADLILCQRFAADKRPEDRFSLRPAKAQGGCSYTLLASHRQRQPFVANVATDDGPLVIQFRLEKHALPMALAQHARRVYSPLAPATQDWGKLGVGNGVFLHTYAMSCIPGQRFSDVQPRTPVLDRKALGKFETALTSVATFFARNWVAGFKGPEGKAKMMGKVGGSIEARLRRLEEELPSYALRERARLTREVMQAGALDPLPVVLTHGDFLPSNIMIDPETWAALGYVDWAEAEWLPFGLCLYGLEHTIGYLDVDGETNAPRVVYYDQADRLRAYFWKEMERLVPSVADPDILDGTLIGRDLGILLWHGFAWDDGEIDRVVNEVDDAEELAWMEASFGVRKAVSRRDSRLAD